MAEVQSRPRGSNRAGRGGRAARGGGRLASRQQNGTVSEDQVSLEDQGELGQLKKRYASQLSTLKEMFPEWSDEDLVFPLQETDGDLQTTIVKITDGAFSRFSDVKKKTDKKTRPKPAEATIAKETSTTATRGRGRGGLEGGRGGRGRGTERSRGGGRGRVASVAAARAAAEDLAQTVDSTGGWDTVPAASTDTTLDPANTSTETVPENPVSNVSGKTVPTSTSTGQKSSLIPEGATKSWASMLATPKPLPAVAKPPPAAEPSPPPPELEEPDIPGILEPSPVPPAITATSEEEPFSNIEGNIELAPPRDRLTEHNLEALPDESIRPATDTIASTKDAQSGVGSVAPYGAGQQQPISRPPVGGYATTAWKAAGLAGRSASFQRKVLEQQEAVVMPGNHAVDRAAVQFGSLGLNGDGKPLDVDEDREEAETRAQPPATSSPTQPRASLPPTSHQQAHQTDAPIPEDLPTPKQAPGFPAQNPQASGVIPGQSSTHGLTQSAQNYNQYSRTSGAIGQEQAAPTQKPYDPFSQQYPQGQTDQQGMYPSQSQANSQAPQHTQSHPPGYSSGPSEYGSQFSAEQRNAYQNYYGGSYAQPSSSNQQDQTALPPRSGSGLGSSNDTTYGGGQASQLGSRFGEAQNSGHTTPNPPAAHQPMNSQSQQGHHLHQQPHSQGHQGAYPYGNPYFGGGYGSYGTYINQYPNQYNYNQQGYGAPYGGKGNMYGQPHHGYGLSPQTSYEHSSSPANAGGYGSNSGHGRDSGLSGLNEYGRSGSAQQSQGPQQSSGSGLGGNTGDNYGRSPSGFSSTQQYGQQGAGASEDSLKPYNDSKPGPSPSFGQGGRPGSSVNNNSNNQSGGQSSFAPPQSQQQGFGGYPSHVNQLHSNHGSQYGSLGGLGGHQGSSQSHQGGGYGNYGGGFGGNSYQSYGRGGWGGNYNH